MKNVIRLTAFIAFISVLASCGSSKKVIPQPVPSQQQTSIGFGPKVVIPCLEKSYDDNEYFRDLGQGKNLNAQNARTAAIGSAKSMIHQKLGGFVQGLTTDYTRTMAGQVGENTQRAMEGELNTLVEKMLNDAEKICEEMTQDQNGAYNSFIVLQISKSELVDKMANTLSADEELKIEFNRDQFRKFAEEKLEKMKDAQKNQ
ncbi:MAG: hypothetical protein ACOYN5_03200 [Bacteroidales bacterium]